MNLNYLSVSSQSPNRGYTLVELMIVIALFGILLSAAVPAYSSFTQSARETQATTQLQKISMNLERYYGERMTYQVSLTELDLPVQDSWYRYRIESNHRKQYGIIATPTPGNIARREFRLNHYGLQQSRRVGTTNWLSGWS